MVARSEVWEEGTASRFEMVNRFLLSLPLKASFLGDRLVGVVSDQHDKVCLPALSFDSLHYSTSGSCSVRRWPSLSSCCWCCPPATGRAGDLALPRGRFLSCVGCSPPSLKLQLTSPSTSYSVRVHSTSDASKQLQVSYLHMWKQVSDAGSGPHFCALLAQDLCGARCRGDKADGLYQDAVLFLVRRFAATVVMARGLEAVGSNIERNMFEANFASFQRSKSVYASKQLMFAVLFVLQSSIATAVAVTLEMLRFLWGVFDQISEADSSWKNISKCCKRALMLLRHHCWRRPCACRSVSLSSSCEFHSYPSGCGTLYLLQATVHHYVFLPFGIRRRRVRASLLRILRFNGQDPPGLSSVMAHLNLQLIPLPQRHLPTRLLVEPLALRLARLQEALEEYDCRCFESEFSPDPLAGSSCTLLLRLVSSVAYLVCVQLGKSTSQGEGCNDCIVICCNI